MDVLLPNYDLTATVKLPAFYYSDYKIQEKQHSTKQLSWAWNNQQFGLRFGHVNVNSLLYKIKLYFTPKCLLCPTGEIKTLDHFDSCMSYIWTILNRITQNTCSRALQSSFLI